MLQCLAFQKFHGDEGLALRLADVVNYADIRMIQGRSGTRLSLKAIQCLLIARQLRRQKLERDVATEAGVFGFVNDTHSSAT